MEAPLLQTKLYIPPTRPELVVRPRLIERLNEGLRPNQGFGRKLTLVSAPAGFGKTTIVSDWIRQSGVPVTWLSLDEGDNDPTRFLTYFIAALQQIEATMGQAAQSMLESPQPLSPETLMTALINEIAAVPNKFTLVLDDYHVIESLPIDQALTFLLDHLPPQMHLIIATRTDPSFPLSRLRARGQITELRADDLRFTFDEITIFLDRMTGLNLSSDHVTALETRTEGWIAGLQLVALSMQGLKESSEITIFINHLTGSHRYIIDYLADEVLQQRPPGTKDFLLQTSILNRMCASLCDTVCSVETASSSKATAVVEEIGDRRAESGYRAQSPISNIQSQAILEALEAANLFIIPLDNERRWYRYHHLFADLLRNRLETSQPDLVPALHRRASTWFEHEDLMSEAIAHSLAAGDFERAAQLTEQTFFDRMGRGEDFATMLARLVALPDDIIRARPRLGIMYAWMLGITLQLDGVEPRLQEVEKSAGDQLPAELQRQIAQIRAELARYRGELTQAIKLSHQVLEVLPKELSVTDMQTLTGVVFNLAWGYLQAGDTVKAQHWFSEALAISQAAGSLHLILLTYRGLAQVHELQGQLRQAYEAYRQGFQLAAEAAQQSGHPAPAMVYIDLGLGELLREWNQLDEADRRLAQGMEMGREWQIGGDTLRDGYLYQARLKQAQGDVAGALDMIRQAEELARAYQSVPGFDNPIAACRARLMLIQAMTTGETRYLRKVEQWVETRELRVDGSPKSINDEVEYLVWVRLLIAQNKPEQALQLLTRLLPAAEEGGRKGRVIEMRMLEALAQQSLGDTEEALATIERALSLAEPEGYVRLFVDEGQPMAKLLGRMKAEGGRMKGYVNRLLVAVGEKEIPSPLAKPGVILHPLVDPLSDRELDVLRLLNTDLSGPEIAEELMVSVNTVKTHIKNIYSKLDAHSRYETVERAKQLGLL